MRWTPDDPQVKTDVPKLDGWDSLSLEYLVKWPMGLLLTPSVLSRYNSLFQFLMRLKRVQLRLEGAWQGIHTMFTHAPMTSRTRGGKTSSVAGPLGVSGGDGDSLARLRQLHSLRHKMAHLIANLQIYIQLDVIESNYGSLKDSVASARDFAEVERSHSHYLHTLVNQCFLNTGTIARAIGSIFVQVQDLCSMVDDYVKGRVDDKGLAGPGRGSEVHSRLQALEDSFKTTSNQLFTYLQSSRLQDVNKAPHLRQLYLRLNFNGFVNANLLGNL